MKFWRNYEPNSSVVINADFRFFAFCFCLRMSRRQNDWFLADYEVAVGSGGNPDGSYVMIVRTPNTSRRDIEDVPRFFHLRCGWQSAYYSFQFIKRRPPLPNVAAKCWTAVASWQMKTGKQLQMKSPLARQRQRRAVSTWYRGLQQKMNLASYWTTATRWTTRSLFLQTLTKRWHRWIGRWNCEWKLERWRNLILMFCARSLWGIELLNCIALLRL